MNAKQTAFSQRFNNAPTNLLEARELLRKHFSTCAMCGSNRVVALRAMASVTIVAHCDHCGSRIPIVVLLNREAWRISAGEEPTDNRFRE